MTYMADGMGERPLGMRSSHSREYPAWMYNDKWKKNLERMKAEAEDRLQGVLRDAGGRLEAKEMPHVRKAVIRRLLVSERIFHIALNRSVSTGAYKRNVEIFKPEYKGKIFYCLGRTNVVRLLQEALLPYCDPHTQRTVSAFLRSIVTEAERLAIVWHLRPELQNKSYNFLTHFVRKQSIQLDGFYKPKRMFREEASV